LLNLFDIGSIVRRWSRYQRVTQEPESFPGPALCDDRIVAILLARRGLASRGIRREPLPRWRGFDHAANLAAVKLGADPKTSEDLAKFFDLGPGQVIGLENPMP
jgi:hypothetical protein